MKKELRNPMLVLTAAVGTIALTGCASMDRGYSQSNSPASALAFTSLTDPKELVKWSDNDRFQRNLRSVDTYYFRVPNTMASTFEVSDADYPARTSYYRHDNNMDRHDTDITVRNPQLDVRSPDVSIRTPAADLNAPDVNVQGPNATVTTPDVAVQTPDVSVRGPNVDINTPDTRMDHRDMGTGAAYQSDSGSGAGGYEVIRFRPGASR